MTTIDALKLAMVVTVHLCADYSASGQITEYDASTRTRTTLFWSGDGDITNATGKAFFVSLSTVHGWDSRCLSPLSLMVRRGGVHQRRKLVEQFDINVALLRSTGEITNMPVSLTVAGVGLQGGLVLSFDDRWKLQVGSFELQPHSKARASSRWLQASARARGSATASARRSRELLPPLGRDVVHPRRENPGHMQRINLTCRNFGPMAEPETRRAK